MTDIEDFGDSAQNMVNRNINRPFSDVEPRLESFFNKSGGLTAGRLAFFESYWEENSRTSDIEQKRLN